MFLSNFLGLFLVTAASAAPYLTESNSLNSTEWTPEHILQLDEVILFGEGRSKLFPSIQRSVLQATLQWPRCPEKDEG